MKKFWNSKSKFFKFVFVYTLVLIVVSISLLVFEWVKLSQYQDNYEDAKKDSEKGIENCIDTFMRQFDKEYYISGLSKELKDTNPYYTKETLAEYKAGKIEFENLEAIKDKVNSNRARNVYNIMQDEKLIATVTIGIKGTDDYGFKIWDIMGVSYDTEIEYINPIELVTDTQTTVWINDTEVSGDKASKHEGVNEIISDRIKEITGTEYNFVKYKFDRLIELDDIVIKDADGDLLQYTEPNESGVCGVEYASEEMEDCGLAALKAVESYINYVNRYIELEEMLALTVPDSQAYGVINDSWDSTKWLSKPRELKVDSSTVENIHVIKDSLFSADVHYVIQRLVYSRTENKVTYVTENIDFTLLMSKVGDTWLIDVMAMPTT